MTLLRAEGLRGGYGRREIIRGVDLALMPGRCLALLGPNGAGKSTLLRLLAGLLPARAGQVELLGKPLTSWRRREIAQLVAFVPQSVAFTFPLTVRELVEQGRAPHLGPWRPLTARDAEVVSRALARVGLADRLDWPVQHLSGGERQRALLARALASEPRVLLLDEPVTALDILHQLELIATLSHLFAEGVGVILVLHDFNLALQLADELVILHEGRIHTSGSAAQVLAPGVFADVFGVGVEILARADGAPVVVPRPRS